MGEGGGMGRRRPVLRTCFRGQWFSHVVTHTDMLFDEHIPWGIAISGFLWDLKRIAIEKLFTCKPWRAWCGRWCFVTCIVQLNNSCWKYNHQKSFAPIWGHHHVRQAWISAVKSCWESCLWVIFWIEKNCIVLYYLWYWQLMIWFSFDKHISDTFDLFAELFFSKSALNGPGWWP